jgi:hypothetical protein
LPDLSPRGLRLGELRRLVTNGLTSTAQRQGFERLTGGQEPKPSGRPGVVQAKITKDGKELAPDHAGRLAKQLGWPDNVVAGVVSLAGDATRSMTWEQVVHEVNAAFVDERIRSQAGLGGADSDEESDFKSVSDQESSSVAHSEASDASEAELARLASRDILAPPALREATAEAGFGLLGSAGRKTQAAFAVGDNSGFKIFGRETRGKDRTWASGKAGGPDRLAEGGKRRSTAPYHAEEKVVLSATWDEQVEEVLSGTADDGEERSIVVLINRSSCEKCEEVLAVAGRKILARMEALRIPKGRIKMGISVLGAYGHANDESTARLQELGWSVMVIPNPTGEFSERAYKQVALSSGIAPGK